MFSTEECAWAQTSVRILGAQPVGIQGWQFNTDFEKEHIYGAGSKPIDINEGNEKPTGNLKLLKYEVDKLNDAAQAVGYANIAKVPHSLISITCSFKKTAQSQMKVVNAFGVAFTNLDYAMEQNAKSMPITLPFLAMEIVSG